MDSSSNVAQQEQAGPTPDLQAITKQQARDYIKQGERRGIRYALIINLKNAEYQVTKAGIGVDADCKGNESHEVHDWMDTGDPCWCGSDNCHVCLNCLAEHHD